MTQDNSAYRREYGNNYRAPPDFTKCCIEVQSDWSFYQCSRKRGHGPGEAYCKQHDPERIKEARLRAERIARAKYIVQKNHYQVKWHGQKFLDALRKIADGQDNPRDIASEAIAAYEQSLR